MCAARMEKEGSKDVLSDNALRGQDDPRDVPCSSISHLPALLSYLRSEIGRPLTAESAHNIAVLAIPTAGKEPQSILPPETRDAKSERLLDLLCGNHDALRLAYLVGFLADVWDNLVDGDSETPSRVNKAFWTALVEIPRNPFFAAHEKDLRPILMQGVVNWHIANEYQKSNDRELLARAHVLRYAIADVVTHMLVIVGGIEYARRVAPEVRAMLQDDTLDAFVQEMENQHAQ